MFEKAKAIIIDQPRHAQVCEIPVAPIDDETIVVETTYSAISTGTEMKVWAGTHGKPEGVWYPLVPGYEEVGRIVYVGKKVENFKVGDRVMANECRRYPEHCAAWGGQCKLIVKNKKTSPSPFDGVAKIPDNVSDQEAVLAYLASVSHKGITRVQPKAGQTVFVIGMGMIGISWIQLAKLAGCRVIGMDINDRRLDLGSKFADEVIDGKSYDPLSTLKKITKDKLADVVVECSGNPVTITHIYQYMKDGGWGLNDEPAKLHLQGDYPTPIFIEPYENWFGKNMNISLTCAVRPSGKEAILQLMSEGKFDAKTLLASSMTPEMPVDKADEAYKMVDQSKKDIFKVMLKW
jgi:2-desacetyl-2-hydroxyethyl bacteriochlorophyllide A dehydrogenase